MSLVDDDEVRAMLAENRRLWRRYSPQPSPVLEQLHDEINALLTAWLDGRRDFDPDQLVAQMLSLLHRFGSSSANTAKKRQQKKPATSELEVTRTDTLVTGTDTSDRFGHSRGGRQSASVPNVVATDTLTLIRHKRQQAGVSQKELAARVGVSPRTYLRWENGQRPLKVVDVIAIADALDCKTTDFFEEHGE
jgi:DNA-binding XRE family transcriptional regulator